MVVKVLFSIAVDVEVPDGLSDRDKKVFAYQKARQTRVCESDILSIDIY